MRGASSAYHTGSARGIVPRLVEIHSGLDIPDLGVPAMLVRRRTGELVAVGQDNVRSVAAAVPSAEDAGDAVGD